jgi:hypothetical protein
MADRLICNIVSEVLEFDSLQGRVFFSLLRVAVTAISESILNQITHLVPSSLDDSTNTTTSALIPNLSTYHGRLLLAHK